MEYFVPILNRVYGREADFSLQLNVLTDHPPLAGTTPYVVAYSF